MDFKVGEDISDTINIEHFHCQDLSKASAVVTEVFNQTFNNKYNIWKDKSIDWKATKARWHVKFPVDEQFHEMISNLMALRSNSALQKDIYNLMINVQEGSLVKTWKTYQKHCLSLVDLFNKAKLDGIVPIGGM